MSASGLCDLCGRALLLENIDGLHYKRGPAHLRWMRGMWKFLERERLAATRLTP